MSNKVIRKCRWCGRNYSTMHGLIQVLTGVEKYCSTACEYEHNQIQNNQEEQHQSFEAEQHVHINVEHEEREKKDAKLNSFYFDQLNDIYNRSKNYTKGPSVSDIEGNSYDSIQIGNKLWLTSDLIVSKWRTGHRIPFKTTTVPTHFAECSHVLESYDELVPKSLSLNYSAEVLNKQEDLLGDGWKVPSKEDWMDLITMHGGNQTAGLFLFSGENYDTEDGYWDTWEIDDHDIQVPSAFTNCSKLSLIAIPDLAKYWAYDSVKNEKLLVISDDDRTIDGFRLEFENDPVIPMEQSSARIRLVKDLTDKNQPPRFQKANEKPVAQNIPNEKEKSEVLKLNELLQSGAISSGQYNSLKKELDLKRLNDLFESGAISHEQYSKLLNNLI